jgi:hypothetical protein
MTGIVRAVVVMWLVAAPQLVRAQSPARGGF